MGKIFGILLIAALFIEGSQFIKGGFRTIGEGSGCGFIMGIFIILCGLGLIETGLSMGAPLWALIIAFIIYLMSNDKEPDNYQDSSEDDIQTYSNNEPTYTINYNQQNVQRYDIDFDALLKFFRERASSGDSMAQACIGLVHRARDCDPDALYELATVFSENKVVARDTTYANELFIRAGEARQGILKKNSTRSGPKTDQELDDEYFRRFVMNKEK